MANYRQIHVSIWKDEWFLDLDPDEKLLFIYLFSNESASLAGIYKIALKVIAFETGLEKEFVADALFRFWKAGKVIYDDGIVWVKNLRKYNRGSSKVDIRIQNDIDEIPDCQLKQAYLSYYAGETTVEPDDTPPIPDEDKQIPYQYDTDSLSGEMKGNESLNKDSKGAGAPAATPLPSNLEEWNQKLKDSKNKQADLLFMIKTLYPNLIDYPDYAYIGKTARELGGAGRLAVLLWECVSRHPMGDILAYVKQYSKGPPSSKNGSGPPKRKPPEMTPEEIAAELAKGKSS